MGSAEVQFCSGQPLRARLAQLIGCSVGRLYGLVRGAGAHVKLFKRLEGSCAARRAAWTHLGLAGLNPLEIRASRAGYFFARARVL